MDEETQRKAFEPFFTTKDVGKGTGLGLSIDDRGLKTRLLLSQILVYQSRGGGREGGTEMKLGQKLVVLFLVVGVVPSTLIALSTYWQASTALEKEAFAKLNAVAAIKQRQVKLYITEILADVVALSDNEMTVQGLLDYERAFEAGGLQGESYAQAEKKWGARLARFKNVHGFYDLLLLAADGDVVYSVEKESDLGENLLRGKLSSSNLAGGFRKTIEGQRVVDFKYYQPSDEAAGFLLSVVHDRAGEKIGAVALQIAINEIDAIMQERTGLGKSGETYLVGADRLMRSNSRFESESSILKKRIDTEAVIEALQGNHDHRIIDDYRGVSVLSSFAPLKVAGLNWAILSEIDEEEAFAAVTDLRNWAIAIGLMALVLIVFVGLFFARNLSLPIVRISEIGQRLAVGDVMQDRLVVTSEDEVGVLGRVFNDLMDYMNEKASAARQIAVGDLSTRVEPRGAADQLGNSFVAMQSYLEEVALASDTIANGDLSVEVAAKGSNDQLGISLGKMVVALRDNSKAMGDQDWLKSGVTRINEVMRGEEDTTRLAGKVVSEICTYLDAKVGALYVRSDAEQQPVFDLFGSYAYTKRKNLSSQFKLGEGLVGQAAREKQQILLKNVPEEYVRVVSGLGESLPRFICVNPLIHDDDVKGVIEIGTLHELTQVQLDYLNQCMPAIAITFESAKSRVELARALQESQALSEELQVQQEELKSSNEELEEQTQALQHSEEKLKQQQEELQVTNEELEAKNDALEVQRREVETARQAIADKAEDLALASKYKSEFLANMSHELRTPLNSLLLLARSFTENKEGNLTDEQVDSAGVIYGSGTDLLGLINEILDLSKIEAGRMDLRPIEVALEDMAESLRTSFAHMAFDKGLQLSVEVDRGVPRKLVTDVTRVQQILKNLISNALKFTDAGSIRILFAGVPPNISLTRSGLDPNEAIAISVTDTGIGVPQAQQKIIFEAFQQVDGSSARKYGGTGLGLSISRELATLLGGEIQLDSVEGEGSTFTLYLPLELRAQLPEVDGRPATVKRPSTARRQRPITKVPDDRDAIAPDEKTILIIEDDPAFAEILVQRCRKKGLKSLVTAVGEEGLDLARRYFPQAILLDIKLPTIDGWQVLEQLKEDTSIRHIPVHIISVEEPSTLAFRRGAIGHIAKPVTEEALRGAFDRIEVATSSQVKRLLVVEDNEDSRQAIVSLVSGKDVEVDEAAGAQEAIEAILSQNYDCMILDLGLWDMDGEKLLQAIEKDPEAKLPPVVVYTGRDLTREEEMRLREYTESIIIKDVRSEERLLDEVSLFLHRVVGDMPPKKRQVIVNLHDSDAMFQGKTVMIVDDDMRSSFALAKLLADRGMKVTKAEDGKRALELLAENPQIDLVLMDIMMPVMDGFETTKRIRVEGRFADLPIIALTAKAMKGDKERCLAAGANDYLTKPVDPQRLLSMMRVWLYN